ncbi:MAG: DUF6361 family protein, partial [Clostridia bacterium]|nr:DUF6361 family protein [Clostridia bacterium]
FFPGTSPIQTRAKYFFCVPYALKDLEKRGETNPNKMFTALSAIEEACGKKFLMDTPSADGIIGRRALDNKSWVKRAPSDIYWAGIRRFGIFTGGDMSLSEYIRFVCASNKEKDTFISLGNRNDNSEDKEQDDIDAGKGSYKKFWNIPTYTSNWQENLSISLTYEESIFLKNQIKLTCKDTMFGDILKNNMTGITDINSFYELSTVITNFPDEIQKNYKLAVDFSEFIYAIRVMYNIIVSAGNNQKANDEWAVIELNLDKIANIDIDNIYNSLKIRSPLLLKFLNDSKRYMLSGDIDSLKATIVAREVQLKGVSRAKTKHAGEFNSSDWYGGGRLDYRFGDAKTIINDIYEGEKNCAEPE